MRLHCIATALVTLQLIVGVRLEAGESFNLETNIYVFRTSGFRSVIFPGAAATGETRGAAVLRSPATAQFDEEMLSLDGSQFDWSGGQDPPDRFSRIATPAVPLITGKPVTLLSTAPVQFFKQIADGTLQVREIPRDSPEAPHCRLTFTLGTAGDASEDLHLTCDLDVATVSARENVPGVTLDVGKPVLARFQEKLDLLVHPEEWSSLLLQAPNGTDYSLLVLLKIVPGPTPDTVVAAGQSGQLMPVAELDEFVTAYYRQPRPELITGAIAALGRSGFVQDREQVLVGFFAEIFAANPNQMPEWRKLIDQQDRPTRWLFAKALKMNRPGAILASRGHSIELNDRCWGAFFASGNPAYVRKLADQLRFIDEDWRHLFWAGSTAMWSLARNAPEHPLVRTTLEAVLTDTDPRTREIIGEVLANDPEAIHNKILAMRRDRNIGYPGDAEVHRTPSYIYNPGSGLVGASNGLPPPNSPGGLRFYDEPPRTHEPPRTDVSPPSQP